MTRCWSIAREVRDEMDGLVADADRAVIARRAEQASVLASLRHLTTYPVIAEAVAAGRLALHGRYFHFGWGLLQAAQSPDGPFRQVDGRVPPPPALGDSGPAPTPDTVAPRRAEALRCDDAAMQPSLAPRRP